ncbi:hypothetical protein [Serinicoccus chungangensis]|uniref:hypothetical protein n=1 Tax=Serinicoccus chungangensis TaxID=767452 RepID=UPI0011186596|nr:hypothetical protein [Serinicoccus chungangensis]
MTSPKSSLVADVLRYAAQETLRHLETSDAWEAFTLEEGQIHTGDDPIQADENAQLAFEKATESHLAFDQLNIHAFSGEERLKPISGDYKRGSRIIFVDPLDGSSLWSIFRQGYCVGAMSLVADGNGRWDFECGLVATPVHTFTLLDEQLMFGATFSPSRLDTYLASAEPENQYRGPSLAMSGYKARDRDWVIALMGALPDWDIITLSGNTATPYVAAGSLTAALSHRPQTTWDALGVLAVATTDAVVGDIEGTVVHGPSFRNRFSKLPDLDKNTRTVPPTIVAKTEERFVEVANAVEVADAQSPRPMGLDPF